MRNHAIIEKDMNRPFFRAQTAFTFALFALVCAWALALLPQTAYAKSYDVTADAIEARVTDGGDLVVTEKRTFDFNGDFSAVWWEFDSLPSHASLSIDGVRVSAAHGGSWSSLPAVPFDLEWREDGGPSSAAYSFDAGKNAVYVFSPWSDESVSVELSYTVDNAVEVYADVAELYWQFIGSGWEVDTQDATCSIKLPVAAGSSVLAGDNVRAWGHGPLDGQLSIGEDGVVAYVLPNVASGQYAEARIAFPSEWMTGVSASSPIAHPSEFRLDEIAAEEQKWADRANEERFTSLVSTALSFVVCAALIVWAFVSFRRFGKELKPTVAEEYWRDVPVPGEHPAVVGRLVRFDAHDPADFTATLLHLANEGALKIERAERPDGGDDYLITRVAGAETTLNSEVDRAALDILFDTLAQGEDALWMGDMQQRAERDPEAFSDAMEKWQGLVSARVNVGEYFEGYSTTKKYRMVTVAVLLFAAMLLISALFSNPLMMVPAIVTCLVLIVVSRFMDRRTQKGADANARCEALKRWLTHFSSLDERPPTDYRVWGEFMVYAYLFGVAKQAMEELRRAEPAVVSAFEDDGMPVSVAPWWVWMAMDSSASIPDVASSLSLAVDDAVSTVASALEGSSSSGDGFGGGFSVGGGGGFGGGGGGAR